MPWIGTYTGRRVDLAPHPDQFSIVDIATSLSRTPRFNGHTLEFYSVAQHSCLVAWQCPHDYRLDGLMHDAVEAYLSDVAKPFKETLHDYCEAEARVMAVIAEKYGLHWPIPSEVKLADMVLLETEYRDLQPHSPAWERHYAEPLAEFRIEPWTMGVARTRFLELAAQYSEVARLELECSNLSFATNPAA